jgi:hypothetical protein
MYRQMTAVPPEAGDQRSCPEDGQSIWGMVDQQDLRKMPTVHTVEVQSYYIFVESAYTTKHYTCNEI